MYKRLISFRIVLIYLLAFYLCNITKVNACNDYIDSAAEPNPSTISKQDVIKLINTQGTTGHYYFEGLSYQLINLDNDDDLEIVAKIDGAVHLGIFFILDKNKYGKYFLAAEREWKVEKLDFADQRDFKEDFKLNQLIERTGGTGVDINIAHLWYLKEGKFIDAWQGTLKERSFFQGTMSLVVGGYQYIEKLTKIFAWSSEYSVNADTNTPIGKPTTTISIYKFDGSKFVLEVRESQEIKCCPKLYHMD